MESIDTEVSMYLQSLPIFRALDPATLDKVSELYRQVRAKDTDWDQRKIKTKVQSCLLLSCLYHNFPYTFSGLLDDTSQVHAFMLSLKETLKDLPYDAHLHDPGKNLIKSYAISLMNYKKIEELFDKFELQGQFDHIKQVFQTAWLFFIICRKEKYQNTVDFCQCGCLIIAVLAMLMGNLPEEMGHSVKFPPIIFLAECFRTVPGHVKEYSDKVYELCRELQDLGIILNDFRTSLGVTRIEGFNNRLCTLYGEKIALQELDERHITNVVGSNDLLLTPVVRRTVPVSGIKGRVLNWNDNQSLNMTTRLKDIEKPKTTNFVAQTPITAAMECSLWLKNIIEEYSEGSISKICGEHWQEIKCKAQELQQDLYTKLNINRALFSPTKGEEVLKLYYIAFESLMNIEKKKGVSVSISGIITNEKFHRALYACSCETVLYTMNAESIPFEDILGIFKISAFDFWKNINSFIQFDIRMPLQIKKYFKDIEEKILNFDGWAQDSPVSTAVNRLSSETFAGELSHASFGHFFKRVLTYCANKVNEISGSFGLDATVQEEIWAAVKYFLSEKTENLINRHIDQMLICTIHGVCRNHRMNEINFSSLMNNYRNLYHETRELFERVKLNNEGSYGNIIEFYNKVYIELMKDYLVKKINLGPPRIIGLNPMSPLKASVSTFQVPQSPFMTPRTKRLWAFGENGSLGLQGINSMIQTTARKINFDMPVKRPRTDSDNQ